MTRLDVARLASARLAGVAAVVFAALLALTALAPPASAQTKIQRVTSPGGIEAWLVEDHTVPLVALQFSFLGGSTQDPAGKEGLANLMSSLLDEGAGDLESQAFQTKIEDLAIDLSFADERDRFSGELKTLSTVRDAAFDLLGLALTRPRFDAEAVERMRVQAITGIRRAAKSPDAIAARLWGETVFPGHPYGRPAEGTEASVGAIGIADLKDLHARLFARKGLKVAVVGDIDAATLGSALDRIFGRLPAEGRLAPVADVVPKTGATARATLPVPQAVIRFGLPGPLRGDPDFIPLYVANHILGGGSFSARLHVEVREKRGLAYSIATGLAPLAHGAQILGSVGTSSDKVDEVLALIRGEFEKLAKDGPSETELAAAKAFLIGSYALRFDTSDKIAGALLAIQIDDLGIDYIEKRNALMEAVTIDDVRRVAKRWLSAAPSVVVVGPDAAK